MIKIKAEDVKQVGKIYRGEKVLDVGMALNLL